MNHELQKKGDATYLVWWHSLFILPGINTLLYRTNPECTYQVLRIKVLICSHFKPIAKIESVVTGQGSNNSRSVTILHSHLRKKYMHVRYPDSCHHRRGNARALRASLPPPISPPMMSTRGGPFLEADLFVRFLRYHARLPLPRPGRACPVACSRARADGVTAGVCRPNR